MSQEIPQVQRTSILDDIQESLRELELAEAPPFSEIINFYGITGIGKTFLLSQIFQRFKDTYGILWFDFDTMHEAAVQPSVQTLGSVLEFLATQVHDLEHLSSVTSGTSVTTPRAEYQLRFIASGLAFAASKPLLLLLDHLETMEYWIWLQEQIIKPLVEQHATLVICASQSPMFWNYWELRDLCTPVVARPFSEQETREYLRQYGREILSQSVQEWAQGYPLQLAQLQPLLIAEAPIEDMSTYNPVVAEEVLTSLSETTRAILRYVGLLRRLEVPIMLQVLSNLVIDELHGQGMHSLLLTRCLPELNRQGLVERHTRGQPQHLRSDLRHALEQHLRISEPARYQHICDILAQIYFERLIKKPIDDAPMLNEWLYFSTVPLMYNMGTLDRETWYHQLSLLFERARLAGKRLAALLFRDAEVMARLRTLNLLSSLDELMNYHFGSDASIPAILNSTELERYRRHIIEKWSEQPQFVGLQREIPGGLATLLHTIASFDMAFDLRALQARLNERPDIHIGPSTVNHAVSLMQSYGMLSYDHRQQTYQLTSQVYRLVAGTPPSAAVANRYQPGTASAPLRSA